MGYSYGGDNRQWNYNAQGSIVAHGQGITLGQPVRDAFAIVHINDGEDVNVQSGRGIYTDAFGNAIVPSLTAYRHNTLTVNTQERSDIDIDAATLDLVPTKGAAILANFEARVGRRALVTLRHQGKPVPFGAIVALDNTTAIVGDDGEVYLSGLNGHTSFSAQWGEAGDEQCHGVIDLPDDNGEGIINTAVNCQ
nr:fimbria/pilus outer membrane usher protein [Enterobacter kobei]